MQHKRRFMHHKRTHTASMHAIFPQNNLNLRFSLHTYWVILHALLSSVLIYFASNFFQIFFQEYHQCQTVDPESSTIKDNCIQNFQFGMDI